MKKIENWIKKKFVPSYYVARKVYKISKYDNTNLVSKGLRIIRSIYLEKKNGICLGRYCSIGEDFRMPHPYNIVIGDNVKIGNKCCIYQGVTIGTSKQYENKYPIIGNNVTIYTGAVVVGNIRIGDNVIIGANAVVLTDIPSDCVVVGIPAKVVETKN